MTTYSFPPSSGVSFTPSGTPITANNTVAVANKVSLMDTTSGALNIDAPSAPTAGMYFMVSDANGKALTNNITVRFGSAASATKLNGASNDAVLSQANQMAFFIYANATQGWLWVRP